MNLLFIGDVVGQPGRRAIADQLPGLRQRLKLDLVVANAENIADGAGVTRKTANELFAVGVDVLSNGNHAWDKKEAFEYITTEPRLLRPHNYPDAPPAPAGSGAPPGRAPRAGFSISWATSSCIRISPARSPPPNAPSRRNRTISRWCSWTCTPKSPVKKWPW